MLFTIFVRIYYFFFLRKKKNCISYYTSIYMNERRNFKFRTHEEQYMVNNTEIHGGWSFPYAVVTYMRYEIVVYLTTCVIECYSMEFIL